MQATKPIEFAEHNESSEEAKHPGALLGLIMGIYPAILIAGILLIFSCIGIGSAYRSVFPESRPAQSERANPAEIVSSEPNLENARLR
jgi:hypothetical protein